MTSRGVWVGRSLRVLGLVAVIVAIYLGGWPAVLAAVAAALVTFGLTIHAVVGFWRA